MNSYSLKVKMMGADELCEALKKTQRATPDIVMRAVRLAGTHFKKEVIANTRKAVKERTGNLCKGFRRDVTLSGKSYGDYRAEIWGGAGKARHYHLIENGHRKFNRAGTQAIGWTQGKFTMKQTAESWESEGKMRKYAEKAVTEALRKGGLDL